MSAACAHRFARFRLWPIKHRWKCVLCGFVTRRYDAEDRMGLRPVHQHMSVACKGVNTVTAGEAEGLWCLQHHRPLDDDTIECDYGEPLDCVISYLPTDGSEAQS